ncbi:MAG: glycogen/starch/alpha-glucan phosphorylase [Candidatus Thiodiazotropha sp.]
MNININNETAKAVHTVRTGLSLESIKRAFQDNLFYSLGRPEHAASNHDHYMAAAYTVRDRVLERWVKTAQVYKETDARTVCYLSAEFLLGPHLANNLNNLGILDTARQAAEELGLDFDAILEEEEEPGLGNGGLGRLAACYLDSLATLQIPAIGYGIRYEFGIFDQEIRDGWQVEISDLWLRNGNPWELPRPKLRFPVKLGGHTEHYTDHHGTMKVRWIPELMVDGVAYDTPILGFAVDTVNLLRLWRSQAPHSFDFQTFNQGDYYGAVNAKVAAENITKVLYPNDEPAVGKELRLKQQYFFVSCSLQDMIRIHQKNTGDLSRFYKKFTAQLNDTHPAIAVPELMRLLIDEHDIPWDSAWEITQKTFAYTNHTLLPEALESWPIDLFRRLLPRHLEIIYEINSRFLDQVRAHFLANDERIASMSLIGEGSERTIRMANLATVGSYAVNGVASMHSELVKSTILRDFHELWPDKFHNVTNGITPRRFVQLSSPGLNAIMTELAGDTWAKDMSSLQKLEQLADDSGFQERWGQAKLAAKLHLTERIRKQTGIVVDPQSLFDVQVKRIHEYKRQHLNVLHIITLYNRLKHDSNLAIPPRTFIFGGKAAPGYTMAKLMIKLITSVGDVVNNDPQIDGRLRIVFMPDFNIKNAEPIYPAADLSEQISTAGKEASGTGNMKFSFNGALTIGTLDGANVEIRDHVGPDNFFLFGLSAEEVSQVLATGYHPWGIYNDDPELRSAIDLIKSGLFSHGDPDLFKLLVDSLLNHDPFLLLADYRSYLDTQQEVSHAYLDQAHWRHMSILNTARMGSFSSDRSIKDYCERIWKIDPMPVGIE